MGRLVFRHSRRPLVAAVVVTVALPACSAPVPSTSLAPEPAPVTIELLPSELQEGRSAALVVRAAGADSIIFESLNGVDRYWADGPELRALITSDFGDRTPKARYAFQWENHTLDRLKKPVRVAVCRRGRCTEHYHELTVRLPERNARSVALSAGWGSVFARRSVVGADRAVLLKEALTRGVWTVEGEMASGGWNVRGAGFTGGGEHGGSLDLSRVILGGDGLSYGLALHADLSQSDWLSGAAAGTGRTAYRLGIGPSIMLKGITASSLLGIYDDGVQTLQISSTRISVNGNLTSVRHPVTITAEKTFAFGGGAIVSRRRDAVERLTAGVRVLDDFAVNVGVSSHRAAFPEAHPSDDLRAVETVITLGGQYSVTW
jgi:hypothetical protein